MASELQDYDEVRQTNDGVELHQQQMALSDYTSINVSAIPSPSSMSFAVNHERRLQATSDMMPPVTFDDCRDGQPDTTCLQPSSSLAYMDIDVNVQAVRDDRGRPLPAVRSIECCAQLLQKVVQYTPAAAAAVDVVTSRTRCSCDVGCPCCGCCVVSSTSLWSPLPAASVAALRDVDRFIARYRVSPPPPLIHLPPAISSVSTSSSVQLESSASVMSLRNTLPDDCWELSRDTATEVLIDGRSDIDGSGTMQQQLDESINQTDIRPQAAGSTVYSDISLEQSLWNSSSSQGIGHSPAPCVPTVGHWSTDVPALNGQASTTASDVGDGSVASFSTNASESGFPPTDCTFRNYSVNESNGNVLEPVSTDPPRSSVMTLAQQLDTYLAQRGSTAASCRTAIQHEPAVAVRTVSRPTAPPPPVPPGSLTSTNATVDRSATEFDERTTQTLSRAASTRSLQAPPPRPPPRSTTQDSNSTSTLLGRPLPREPLQMSDMSATLDRSCRGHMTTFQGHRTLRESGLSGSVQSLPGCDVASSSLTAGSTTSHGRPAPQPPRRGSSMSPRLQTKSAQHRSRARSTSLRSTDADVDADDPLWFTGSSSARSATQQLEVAVPSQSTSNVAVRETARQATVFGQKPVAQIRPHAIRSPSASSYTRQRITDEDESKRSVASPTYVDKQSSEETRARGNSSDTQMLNDVSVSTDRQSEAPTNASGWRFGTLRSRIKDYVTAAAGVGASRRQPTSSSFADWTMPRGRRQGVARRSSSATSWEPDRSDYAFSGSEPSRGSTSFDDSATWSSSSYFGVFPGPRPFSSPRSRATEVSLPQNIIASANSSVSAADVTSSITSRISTFLTFLGGSRRPAGSSPTSDTPPSTSSTTPHLRRTDSTGIERFSDAKTPTTKAVVDPIISSGTLERRSCRSVSSPPVRSASTSEALARAAAAAAAAARDAHGRQPLKFVREQRPSMSTFRSSGSLSVSVVHSSSFSSQSTSTAREAAQHSPQSSDGYQISDGRRTSKSGTLDGSTTKHLPAVAHQSAPSTPLDWNDGGAALQTMTSSLPVDNSVIRPSLIDRTTGGGESLGADDVVADSSRAHTVVALSVFRQVDVEVERLIELLQSAVVPDDRASRRDSAAEVEAARESLLALTRQFVDDSQRLVSGATRSVDALVAGVEPSLATLTRLSGECRSTAALVASPSHGVMLVGRVRDLAQAYRSTVSAARSAVGHPFNSVEMKSLMRQATSLAAMLSSLIKMLNRNDIIC